jgi:hypothetical protein
MLERETSVELVYQAENKKRALVSDTDIARN